MSDSEVLMKLVAVRMPFGKYEGRRLSELPESYLLWFQHEGFPAGELGELMALMLEIRVNGLEALLEPLRQAESVY
ncbi:MAG: DUF3820 family protein [Marinobacterium sp.]|nr:DUF3820 family protein [Marinobacterium sp.]